jgi:hypothetical protein
VVYALGRPSTVVHPEQMLSAVMAAALARLLGPDHPDTLQSRNNLANAYQAAGRLGES